MRNNSNSTWTEALTADLIRLWSHGYSCSQIGALIGCTRNAVIGKAHRLQLPTHTRCNFNGQKRAINPIPPETPRSSKPRTKPTVFKSRERKPRTKIPNPDARPPLIVTISSITGQYGGAIKFRRQRVAEMTKAEMREMLTTAVQNTAAKS